MKNINIFKSPINSSHKWGSILLVVMLITSGLFIFMPSILKISTAEDTPTTTEKYDNDFINGTLNNLTIIGIGAEVELRLNSSDSWEQKNLSIKPNRRVDHAMAHIYETNKILLFGGYYNEGLITYFFNDTWLYDFNRNKWINKTSMIRPDARWEHEMAPIHGTDKVLLFTGITGGPSTGNPATWVFDLSEGNWTKKSPNTSPGIKVDHAIASIWGTDKVLLFGGSTGGDYFDETWVYDLSIDNWTKKIPMNKPSPRRWHTLASIYGQDKVLLFGGQIGKDPYSDDETWVYDLSDNNWTNKTNSIKPKAKLMHEMTSIYGTDKVMLFGGSSGGPRNDTWIYDLSENTWTLKMHSISPSNRYNHDMANIYGTDKVVLFGGIGEIYKNDTWIYHLNLYEKSGFYISDPYYIGQNFTFKTIKWDSNISINTSIKFQLRSSATEDDLNSKVFIGPDGTTKTYYLYSPSDIWSGHNNDSWMQYKAYLSTKNVNETPRLKNVTLIYNYLPNTTLIDPNNGSIKVYNKPTFEWNFTDRDSKYQSAFQVLIDDDIGFNSVDYDSRKQNRNISNWQFPDGSQHSELGDGVWYWKARTKDNDGTWGLYSQPWKLVIDTRPPSSTITIPMNNGLYFNVKTITGLASDPINGTGLDRIEITIQRLNDNNYWSGNGWVSNETWLLTSRISNWFFDCAFVDWTSGNQYRVRSRAIDNATNIELPTNGNVFTIDQDRPISNIDYPVDNSYLNDLDIIMGSAFDGHGYGIDSVEISIKRFGDRKYWTGSNWVATQKWLLTSGNNSWTYDTNSIPWTSGALYWIQSRAIDNASNMEIPGMGIRFYIDMARPSSEIEIPLNNSFVNNLKEISGTAADIGGAGIISMEICIKQFNAAVYWGGVSWTFDETWLGVKGTERWIFNSSVIDWKTDTNYIIRSRAMDNASNIEFPGPGVTFIFDNKPPNNSIIINGDEEYTNSYNVVLSLEAEDSGSGVDQMAFSTDRISWGLWVHFASEMAFELPPMDGEKVIYCRVRDLAGNIAEPAFDTIILDTTPPEERSIIINDHAKYSKSELVLLTLSATDSLSGVSKMTFSFDSFTWTPWEPFDTKKSIKLPTVDGKKTVYFKVMDNAGNFALAADSITLDTSPPHSLAIIIDPDNSDSESLILKLSAFDNLSSVYQMSFSLDGFNWEPWENFAHIKYYPLPNDVKVKFIYFRANDKAGNTAEPVSAKIPSGKDEGPGEPSILSEYWFILLIILIVIFIVIIIVFVRKRKRPGEHEEPVEEAIMVKPGKGPETESYLGELPTALTPPQLPETTTSTKTQQSTLSIQKVPTLASSTAPGQIPETRQIPQVTQIPQLPSAQPETSETIEESAEEPTPDSDLDKPIETQEETDQNSQEKD